MTIDKKVKEHSLLFCFQNFTVPARRVLLDLDFDAIKRIDANNWFDKFEGINGNENRKFAKRMIQFEIIAKINILIEDLAILAESRLRDLNYYELLDKKLISDSKNLQSCNPKEDVGLITEKFFLKLNSSSEEEICKIMSYPRPEQVNGDCIELLKSCLERDIREIKRILKTIGDFGKEHHPVFRRYKHAGFPILPELQITDEMPESLRKFDFLSAVPVNEDDPFKEPKIIPFSNDILEGYLVIIKGILRLLGDILQNRIKCLQLDLDYIPCVGAFCGPTFSIEEHRILEKKLAQFHTDYPARGKMLNIALNTQFDSSTTWYGKLPEFLEESRHRSRIDKEYKEKLHSP